MFADDLSENWDSTENQDIFIKKYFGKTKVLPEHCKDLPVQVDDFKNYVQNSKDKNENREYQHENIRVTSSQRKSKRSINNNIELTKKKAKKSTFLQDECISIDENKKNNEIEVSYTADLHTQKSKKKRKKSKKKNGNAFEQSSSHDKIPEEINTQNFVSSKSESVCTSGTASANLPIRESVDEISSNQIRNKYSLNWDIKLNKKNVKKAGTLQQDGYTKIGGNYKSIEMKDSDNININCQEPKKKIKKAKKKEAVIFEEQSDKILEKVSNTHDSDSSECGGAHSAGIVSHNSPINKSPLMKNKFYHKLQAAKFRYLNEMLYTNAGKEALSYFQQNTDEFQDYHAGYQSQVSKWPINPVDIIIQEICQMNKEIVVADLGCGEAKIAKAFPKRIVHSFDLIALKDCVTACDIAKVPLPNDSVDVAVFCLSLMGTNWKEYLKEGHRILKLGAVLKIAEIESRIEDLDLFVKNIENYGFYLENKNLSHKMFIFLNFKKINRKRKASKVSDITLKPCLYKKR